MEASEIAKEVAQEYASSLADLTVNSKPLINMLTMLAEENLHHAAAIVQAVEKHLLQVAPEYKLPVLYLIDSIVKNVGHAYTNLFTQNIVSTFCGVFEKVDEKTRAQMFKLRHTWNEMFPSKKLYAMDVRVSAIDPAWPVTAPPPSIHINPKFLKSDGDTTTAPAKAAAAPVPVITLEGPTVTPVVPSTMSVSSAVKAAASEFEKSKLTEAKMREELLKKQKELLELQQKKIELELLQAKSRLEEQQRQMQDSAAIAAAVAVGDPTKAQQLLATLQQAQQLQAVRLLAEQKASAARPTIATVPAPKAPAQVPGAPDAALKASTHQRTVTDTRIPKLVTSEPNSNAMISTNVLADSKPKLSNSQKPAASASLNNKESKVGMKDTFLNKDPRIANKRISPVPKSMAALATQNKDRLNVIPQNRDSNNLPATKSTIVKQKPSYPKIKKSPSPMKGTPELSESSTVEPPGKGISSSSSVSSEAKASRDGSESSKTSASGLAKKGTGKNLKKSPLSSSQGRPESRSPKNERSKSSKYPHSSMKHTLNKSVKEITKNISKVGKKETDSKKVTKDRKRDSENISGSKSPGSKIKSDVASGRVFKDIKSHRSRNYIRRNRSVSESPEPPTESGDVDLRSGPPEKIPRNATFKDDPDAPNAKPGMSPPGPPFQMEANLISKSSSPDVSGKDVDLRQLSTSPASVGKKRASSAEKTDQPSPKKSKAEMIDVLFGNEDVDLRQLAPPISIDIPNEESKEKKKAPDWARFKEVNPDTYKSPLKNSTWETSSEHGSEVDIQAPPPPPRLNSSAESPTLRTPPLSRSVSRDKQAFDRLGRPLLYNRPSVEDPRERRRSLSSQSTGEDTDMRHTYVDPESLDDVDASPRNISIIISQADEQLKNGTISISQYNTLLKQMVHLNEIHKLREAQRRDEQETWDNSGSDSWDQERSRSDDDKDSDRSRDNDRGSPKREKSYKRFSKDNVDGSSHYSKSGGAKEKFGIHGDIDERLPIPSAPTNICEAPSLSGQERGMGTHSATPSGPHGPMGRPWAETHGPGGPPHGPGGPPLGPGGPPHGPAGPHGLMGPRPPHWEEPGWQGGPHPRMPGPPGPHGPPVGPGIPPHHIQGPRPHFGRGRGDFGPRFMAWQQQQQQPPQEHFNQAGSFPFNGNQGRFRPQFRGELPPVDARELEMLEQDSMKTINIDGCPREIRYYGDTAIIMMKWDDPRELSFQAGTRRVIFNGCENFPCSFGDNYRDVLVGGVMLSIKLGSPTRELFIDGRWFECYFGGPPINAEIKGKVYKVQLEGPPPQVKIGQTRRTDLVAGKVNLIIDANIRIPIFLDPKPQKFVIDGKPHILRFVEAFRTALINGRPFRVNFGGLPMPIIVRDNKHFIGFSALPPGIHAGYISITNMEGGRLPSPPPEEEMALAFEQEFPGPHTGLQQPPQQPQQAQPDSMQGHQPAMPMLAPGIISGGNVFSRGYSGSMAAAARGRGKQFQRSRSSPVRTDQLKPGGPVGGGVLGQQGIRNVQQGQLDVLSSLMPGAVTVATGFSYQVHEDASQPPSEKQPAVNVGSDVKAGGMAALNIGELLQKLVATGILPSGETAESKREEDSKAVKPVTFTPDSLKLRQAGVFTVLYSGIQCSSCGVRFPPEQTMKYSQHLDWHFRQNRRERDSAKKAQSRKWYYDVSDWIQFEEIEDLEERAQSWFETQVVERPEEREQELLSVPAGENSEDVKCAMCHEGFEQFYNEDKEEWHLKDAIRVDDDKTYHPICYEDYKNAMEASLEESMNQAEGQEAEVDTEMKADDEKEGEAVVKPEAGAESLIKKEIEDFSSDVKTEEDEVVTTEPSAEVKVESQSDEVKVKEEPIDTTEEGGIEDSAKMEMVTDVEEESSVSEILIKSEPVDTEENIIEPDQSSNMAAMVDTTSSIVTSSIDGNVELEETAPVSVPTGKIKINISKIIVATPAPAPVNDTHSDSETEQADGHEDTETDNKTSSSSPIPPPPGTEDLMDEDAPPPPPPGEDNLHLKPRLIGRKLTELPPVLKGTELSGLCSIM